MYDGTGRGLNEKLAHVRWKVYLGFILRILWVLYPNHIRVENREFSSLRVVPSSRDLSESKTIYCREFD